MFGDQQTMELTTLRHFVAIAREGHVTRAARTMGVSQPALSAMLRKLEIELDAKLLHRTARGVELTEAGKVFAQHAEEAIRRAEAGIRAVKELQGLEQGSIRIGGGATATTFLLPPVISAIRRSHPGLRFYVREDGSSSVADAVLSGELDLGIVTLPVLHPQADRLHKIPLASDELRLIVPPAHELAAAHQFRWTDLQSQSVVAFEGGSAVRDLIDRAAAAAGVALNVVMELRSIESIRRMVTAGIGVGFVSRFALRNDEGLTCKDARLERRLAIVRLRDREPTPAGAMFEKMLLETVAKG